MQSSTILQVEHVDGVAVVTLGERLDLARAADFRGELTAILEGPVRAVVLDLRNLEFLDSSGLGVIVALWKQFSGRRGFALGNLRSDWIASVLRMTRMDQLLPIHTTLDQAVAAARAGSALEQAGV